MTSTITDSDRCVFVGVDTHADVHHVAVVDPLGRALADRACPASLRGYSALTDWCAGLGVTAAVGVEGTSSYGAALAGYLACPATHVHVRARHPPPHTV